MTEALLDVNDLIVRFQTRQGMEAALSKGPAFVTAVDKVSLSIRPGEILGLVGESGSGKTTFGKTILRLIEPDSGSIRLREREISKLSDGQFRSLRRQLQMVFQDPLSSINPRQRIRDVLATPLRLHGLADRRSMDKPQ